MFVLLTRTEENIRPNLPSENSKFSPSLRNWLGYHHAKFQINKKKVPRTKNSNWRGMTLDPDFLKFFIAYNWWQERKKNVIKSETLIDFFFLRFLRNVFLLQPLMGNPSKYCIRGGYCIFCGHVLYLKWNQETVNTNERDLKKRSRSKIIFFL